MSYEAKRASFREDIRLRDWRLGLDEEFGTIQFLSYSPDRELPLFGFEPHTNGVIADALTRSHKHMGELKWNEALACLEKVSILQPSLVAAQNLKAYALFQQKNFEDSVEALQIAITETKGLSIFWHAKGSVLFSMGSFGEASDCFQQAISRSFFEKSLPTLHWTHLAYYLHDFPKAVQCLRAAIKLAPDDLRTYPILARALQGAGKNDKALEVYDAYIQLTHIEWIYYLKAGVLFDLKLYDECQRFCLLVRAPQLRDQARDLHRRCRDHLATEHNLADEPAEQDIERHLPTSMSRRSMSLNNLLAVDFLHPPPLDDSDTSHSRVNTIEEIDDSEEQMSPGIPSRNKMPPQSSKARRSKAPHDLNDPSLSPNSKRALSKSAPYSRSRSRSIGVKMSKLFGTGKSEKKKSRSSRSSQTLSEIDEDNDNEQSDFEYEL